MKSINLVLLLIMGMTGCASLDPITIVLPNGNKGIVVDCTNAQWGACFQSAGDACPKGYKIFERSQGEFTKSKIPLSKLENKKGAADISETPLHQTQQPKDKYMVISCST